MTLGDVELRDPEGFWRGNRGENKAGRWSGRVGDVSTICVAFFPRESERTGKIVEGGR